MSRSLQVFDPCEQFAGEHRAGVVDAEIAAQSRRAREQRPVRLREQRCRRGPPARRQQPELHETADDLGVQAGLARERLERHERRAGAAHAHERHRMAAASRARHQRTFARIEFRCRCQLLEQLAFLLVELAWARAP